MIPFLVGCSQGMEVQEAFNEVRGGEPQVTVIRDFEPSALLEYRHVKVEPIANEMGDALPSYVAGNLREAFHRVLLRAPAVFASDPGDPRATLIVRGSLIHYQTAGSVSKMLGGYSLLICRIQLIDGANGKVLGVANCGGFSQALARSGAAELANGSAKALRRWLTRHHAEKEPTPEG